VASPSAGAQSNATELKKNAPDIRIPAIDGAAERTYDEMAGGRMEIGSDILFTRGMAEWLRWYGSGAYVGSPVQNRTLEKYELQEASDEIVVLLANIVKEATLWNTARK